MPLRVQDYPSLQLTAEVGWVFDGLNACCVSRETLPTVRYESVSWTLGKVPSPNAFDRVHAAICLGAPPRGSGNAAASSSSSAKTSNKRRFDEFTDADAVAAIHDNKHSGGTNTTYASSCRQYEAWCAEHVPPADPYPASESQLTLFAGHMVAPRKKKGKGVSNIPGMLSAVRDKAASLSGNITSGQVSKATQGKADVTHATPASIEHCKKLLETASTKAEVDCALTFAEMWFALARAGHFHELQQAQVDFDGDKHVAMNFPRFKGHPSHFVELERLDNPLVAKTKTGLVVKLCPAAVYKLLVKRASTTRVANFPDDDCFRKALIPLISKSGISSVAQNTEWGTHSARTGGACTLALSGMPADILTAVWNWSSVEQALGYCHMAIRAPRCVTPYKFWNPKALKAIY